MLECVKFVIMKTCNKCKIEQEYSGFCSDKTRIDNLSNICKICTKKYRDINKDRKNQYNKDYGQKNKIKRRKYNREHNKERRQTDILFRLYKNIGNLVYASIKRKGHKKNSKTEQILGCTISEFKQHIENQFEHWMTWENQGQYNGELNYGWDIDHIIPSSSANCETKLLLLNHYTNLQPLCSKINRDIKRDKLNYII